jgi:hypothetical protein
MNMVAEPGAPSDPSLGVPPPAVFTAVPKLPTFGIAPPAVPKLVPEVAQTTGPPVTRGLQDRSRSDDRGTFRRRARREETQPPVEQGITRVELNESVQAMLAQQGTEAAAAAATAAAATQATFA